MKRAIKRTIRQAVRNLGFDIIKMGQMPTLRDRVGNFARLGFKANVIVDGGAHKGKWTQTVSEFFPNSKFILVEPNPTVYTHIKDTLSSNIQHTVVTAALGETKSRLRLNIWDDVDTELVGSSLCGHVRGEAAKQVEVDVVPLDSLIDIYNEVPNFVKLDLQGYEIHALKGATETLKHAELMIIEFGLLDAYVDRTTVRELINFMHEYDYSLYDLIDLHYRPYDNALTGGDFIFVKNSSKLKEYKGWE
jgi:FkbM family methyltransferase